MDYFLQLYRAKQDPVERENPLNYPHWSEIEAGKRWNDPALPFKDKDGNYIPNYSGLSNLYDENIKYVESPGAKPCTQDVECTGVNGRKALWCQIPASASTGWCKSKIRKGGKCNNLPHKACYKEKSCTVEPQCKAKFLGLTKTCQC